MESESICKILIALCIAAILGSVVAAMLSSCRGELCSMCGERGKTVPVCIKCLVKDRVGMKPGEVSNER